MLFSCPNCNLDFHEPLVDGIIWCSKCEKMIQSTKKNVLLSAYRICLKNSGHNLQKIKHDLKLTDKDFNLIETYLDECYSFQDFEKELKKIVC